MPSKLKKMRVYVSDDEYELIKATAKKQKMSMSTFVKQAGLKRKIKSKVDPKAVAALAEASEELRRLGALLKEKLTDDEREKLQSLGRLGQQITQAQKVLQEKIAEL